MHTYLSKICKACVREGGRPLPFSGHVVRSCKQPPSLGQLHWIVTAPQMAGNSQEQRGLFCFHNSSFGKLHSSPKLFRARISKGGQVTLLLDQAVWPWTRPFWGRLHWIVASPKMVTVSTIVPCHLGTEWSPLLPQLTSEDLWKVSAQWVMQSEDKDLQ